MRSDERWEEKIEIYVQMRSYKIYTETKKKQIHVNIPERSKIMY